MKKSLVIIVLVIAAVLVVAALWMRGDDENGGTPSGTSPSEQVTPDGEQTGESQAVITYDGSGFSPDTVTVSAGDTVTFRNESSTAVWPASDVHPTHNELPGFDALESLDQGEEYSFTFEDAGEWSFHNHLNSSQGGTIIVE